jgi:hypothetical protein
MKLQFVSFRRFSLRVLSVFLLAARPGNAQTLKTGPTADRLRPGNEINLDHGTDETSNELANDHPPPWFAVNTLGPRDIVAGLASAGLGTSIYKGRGDAVTGYRFGQDDRLRAARTYSGNTMEATWGAIGTQDLRDYRVAKQPFARRVRNVIRMTFVSYRGDRNPAPRSPGSIGISGSGFLAASWRGNNKANVHDTALRTFTGFLGRMGSIAFQEFSPDVKRRIFRE